MRTYMLELLIRKERVFMRLETVTAVVKIVPYENACFRSKIPATPDQKWVGIIATPGSIQYTYGATPEAALDGIRAKGYEPIPAMTKCQIDRARAYCPALEHAE